MNIRLHRVKKPGILLIDDDAEFGRTLRMSLGDSFDLAITDHQIDKLSPFLKDTDIILLSVEMKLDLLNWNRLFSMIKKRKNESELPVIYITESKEREQEANDFFRGKKICICKETEPIKNARYLIARYL